jgi:hypothetical protein
MTGRLRAGLSLRRVQAFVVLAGVLLVAALIVTRLPRPVEAPGDA